MSEILLFTLVAIALYLASDAIVRAMERRRGKVLEHRSLIFLAIMMPLSLISFALIRRLLDG